MGAPASEGHGQRNPAFAALTAGDFEVVQLGIR
jgi:hypothetical protein